MINIIKALNYAIKRDVLTYISIVGGLLLALIPFLAVGDRGISALNGGMYMNIYTGVMLFLPYIMSCIIGAKIIGSDMGDKTINYEVMSGHSRIEAFWGRVATAYIWNISICIVVSALPIGIVTLVLGWGNNFVFSQLFIKYLINIASSLRIMGLVVIFTTITNHPVAGGFITYGVLNLSMLPMMLISEFLDTKIYHVFAMSDILYMSEILNTVTIVHGEEMVEKYVLNVSPRFCIESILITFLVSVIYLLFAFGIFKKRDMR